MPELKAYQPWSAPVLHTALPDEILKELIQLTDIILKDKDRESSNKKLVGEIEDEWEEDETDDRALDDSMQLAFDSFWRTIGEAHNRADLQRTSVAYSFLLQSINYLKKVGWGEEELLMEAKTQYRNHNVVAKAKKTGPA